MLSVLALAELELVTAPAIALVEIIRGTTADATFVTN